MESCKPLDWRSYFQEQIILDKEIPIYIAGKSGPNIVCLHGAGHSALSFAPLAKENKDLRVISFDFRGHGLNELKPRDDLSMETMIKDTQRILKIINEMYPEDTIIIVGHSFGGSVAIKACCEILKSESDMSLCEKIQAILVIDVVEGSAIEALPFMMSVVSNRKQSFDSIEEAIQYMHKTQIRNLESARVSIPPLLKEIKGALGKKTFEWKTDLVSTEPYWKDWYTNMSNNFLSLKIPKALILSDKSSLDTPLTIAHMQGKFKLIVKSNVGHFIHEDDPSNFYAILKDFIQVFQIVGKVKDIKKLTSKLGDQSKIVKYVEFKG